MIRFFWKRLIFSQFLLGRNEICKIYSKPLGPIFKMFSSIVKRFELATTSGKNSWSTMVLMD